MLRRATLLATATRRCVGRTPLYLPAAGLPVSASARHLTRSVWPCPAVPSRWSSSSLTGQNARNRDAARTSSEWPPPRRADGTYLDFDTGDVRAHVDPVIGGHFRKVLIANRGEIAIRIARACHELRLRTVAIYAHADKLSRHVRACDEAYAIGSGLLPVQAYLAMDDIIAVAKKAGADAIHPGYGFLSERADFARRAEAAGIRFVGPTPDAIEAFGDKTKARELAERAGVPVVPGSGALKEYADCEAFAKEAGYPILLKAAFGGGGRGMRIVRGPEELRHAFDTASSEALAAFGDGTMFGERFVERARHIEVQVIGDATGEVVHLFERDCSVQRRFQKVIEEAPAPYLPKAMRQRMLDYAIALAKVGKYRNAGTVEFLVDAEAASKGLEAEAAGAPAEDVGGIYFMEVNPRVQVEHTVTEEVTDVDVVQTQLLIASGRTLADLGLDQSTIRTHGAALQCRVTCEDPRTFVPDHGEINVYTAGGGPGVRLDGGPGFTGAVITPHYDSLLTKMTCRAPDRDQVIRRTLRQLAEVRVRPLKTNVPFIKSVLQHRSFRDGAVHTRFIDKTPELFNFKVDPATTDRILQYLGDMTVNGPKIEGQVGLPEYRDDIQIPTLPGSPDLSSPPPEGWRQVLASSGPEGYARAVRAHQGPLFTDTTWRDAHQSLLMTRVRTYDLKAIAPTTAHGMPGLGSLEMWGGATFDVAYRFLHEDPWARLRDLRELVPNIPFQMLLRGANALGYSSYPDNVVETFCRVAVEQGMDIFRVFDANNYFDNVAVGIDAVVKAGGVAEAAVCYTGDIMDSGEHLYTLDYYRAFAKRLVEAGAHMLAVKDMAGLLRPSAVRVLIGALREDHPDVPISVHTHDTAGAGVAAMIAALESGADKVDGAVDSMSGLTSQPSLGALVAAVGKASGQDTATGVPLSSVQTLSTYWEVVRKAYSCFDPGLKSSTSDVYKHEIPGGQYSNLYFQAASLGLGTQWQRVKQAYADANRILGHIVKVTPTSKVVGDLAQFMVSKNLSAEEVEARASKLDFPESVVEFFDGALGPPPGGFPEPLRTNVLRGRKPRFQGRPGADLPPHDFDAAVRRLRDQYGEGIGMEDALSEVMFPKVYADYKEFQRTKGGVETLPTHLFLAPMPAGKEVQLRAAEGKPLFVSLVAQSAKADGRGNRSVLFTVGSKTRAVSVRDDTEAARAGPANEKADPRDVGSVGAPMSAMIARVEVEVGQEVEEGATLMVLSAMKMETRVTAPCKGTVAAVPAEAGAQVAAGDLLCRIMRE
eukprot:TRINITY_DN3157_c0_g1_i1.p1 TRINITY_DN3157_c0_g1~~TRINITY_DN3157_c0_g1_i1.p1  ORF type:complete len:1272 (+),score=420.93 TRINITY_DN3157_c0_g1_i1:274-4089(+)